ncbi:uncharacterized protein A1O9_09229 [Exophiala aquamarina CBS 119918]|uniref:Acyclic terpene utilisation N-terminal domain-containing protein n=1 Tax=Exophiala aquamarina CBS 119918 TaxID=1182545 RepID=A0A072P521_9EURO|nr:uncharacterized protein A1O9_09229 [Exophiala aquamarina CBS 119918]KEF54787.1 hypothetical protein A1O9_09229 [Exophiala aquamarina CBS 119918]
MAELSEIRVEAEHNQSNHVRVYGARGIPPPSTMKVTFTAPGVYQAEATFYINGLDIAAKVAMMRKQLDYAFKDNNFSKWSEYRASYPGYHMGLDFRTMEPKAFMEIFPSTISIAAVDQSPIE